MAMQSFKQLFNLLIETADGSPMIWYGAFGLMYFAMGVLRAPGQTLCHLLVAFKLGAKLAFPCILAAYTGTSLCLFYLGSLYAQGGSVDAWEYYAHKIDVFLLKISQAKFGIYVDTHGQRYDKERQKEMAADKNYDTKVTKVRPQKDDWDEWSQWCTPRFMHMLYMRVFPFSEHWLMNMGSGLVKDKGVTFTEFFLSTFLGEMKCAAQCCAPGLTPRRSGNIPYCLFVAKLGELMKTYYLQEMLAWPNVKWPIVVTLMVLPPAINHSGCLQKLQLNQGREYGWNVSRGTRTERKDE